MRNQLGTAAKLLVATFFLAGMCLLAGTARAQTVSLDAAADSYLQSGSANQNQGGDSFLRVRSSGKNRALVGFDPAAISATVGSGSLVAAHLELFIESNGGGWGSTGRNVDAHKLTAAWTEAGVTWNCPEDTNPGNSSPDCPAQWAGGTFAPAATASVLHTNDLSGWVSFDVTADVAAQLAGGSGYGWLVKLADEGPSGNVSYTSREGTAGQAPRLVLEVESPAIDETPPSLAITSPGRPYVVGDAAPDIVLHSADGGSGVDVASLHVSVDGIEITAGCTGISNTAGEITTTCQAPPLAAGPHTASAELRDLAGNLATTQRAFELLLGPGPHTVHFGAVADTYLRDGSPNQNQGDETALRVRSSGHNRALVRFDAAEVADVVGTGEVVAASLDLTIELNADNWGTTGRTVDAHRLLVPWSELGATWNCASDGDVTNQQPDCDPQWDGGTYAATASGSVVHTNDLTGPIHFDVTADVAAFLAGTAEDHGWLVKKTLEGQNGHVEYTSREGTAAAGPGLTVVFTTGAEPTDTTPPTLAITAPAAGAVLEEPTTTVSLSFADAGSGIDAASLRVGLNGFDLLPACIVAAGSATCPTPPLASEAYQITASVRDLAGNLASASRDFEVLAPQVIDETPPDLVLVTPADGAQVDTFAVTFEATYSDAGSGIAQLSFQLLVDEEDLSRYCTAGPAGATCTPPPLVRGEHTATASVTDLAFNLVEATATFTVNPAITDTQLPTLSIAPAFGTTTTDVTPAITVTYADAESGINLSSLRVAVDTSELTDGCTVGPGSAVCVSVPLSAGVHRAWASVGDLSGNTLLARTQFTVELAAPDTQPPVITWLAPAAGQVLQTPALAMEATLADTGAGVDVSSLQVLVDGVDWTTECTATPERVSCESPPLEQGPHSFLARVADLAGNQAEASVSFEVDLFAYDTTPPDLEIVTPAGTTVDEGLLATASLDYRDDETGVDTASLHVRLDGSELSCTLAAGSIDCPLPPLAVGDHALEAELRDMAGNLATASRSFTVVGERVPPALILLAPATDVIVGDGQPQITVSYSDASGVDPATFRLLLDGSDATGSCVVGAQEATCLPPQLTSGVHRLEAEVRDLHGNLGTLSFVFEVHLHLDIAIDSPTSGLMTRDGSIDVTGTVSPQAQSVTVGEVAADVADGAFVARDVPLREGGNTLTAVAQTAAGGIGTAAVTVVRDTTAPLLVIHSPPDGLVTTASQILVTGEYNDPASSAVESEAASVEINGLPARVEQRSFLLDALLLQPGENRIQVAVTDLAGNTGTAEVRVVSQPDAPLRIEELLGNGQTAGAGEELPQPLVVRLRDSFGAPLVGRQVRFEVTRGAGLVKTFGSEGQSLVARTDEQGLAQVRFVLGPRSGSGSHEVTVTSPGISQSVLFCASAAPGAPQRIVRVVGNEQSGALAGAAGQAFPKPFYVQVFDALGNPLEGVPVTWEAILGGGSFAGEPTAVTVTDNRGIASARFTLGPDPGLNNNLLQVSFEGLEEPPVNFTVTGRAVGLPQATAVVGVVLNNEDLPVPNVTMRLHGTSLSTVTGADGRFRIDQAPVGTMHLEADGTTTTLPGTWPRLEFEITTVSGQDNDIGMPIRLLPLDPAGGAVVGGSQDVTLPISGVEGASITVFANSVTFPDGSHTGTVSVTQVHGDKVPMQAPMGSNFMLAWTVQPPGAHFNPPARISIPNIGGAPPGAVVDIFSFDHDLGEFVASGTATVTADGRQVVSNPGFGVVKAGWHGCVPPPRPPVDCCNPGNCTVCVDKATAPTCDPVCQRCEGAGCAERKFTKVTAKANKQDKDDKLIVSIDQEVTFMAIGLTGDLIGTCPADEVKYAWDFGDMKTSEGKETEKKHKYKKAGDFTAKVTVTCGKCPMAMTDDTIKLKVIDFVPEVSFQRIDTAATNLDSASTDKLKVVEKDLDGDGENELFSYVLGGVRQKLEAKEAPELAGKIKEYRWSAMSGKFYDGFRTTAMEISGDALKGVDKKKVFWEGEWKISQNWNVEVKAILDNGDEVIGTKNLRTRLLKTGENGDDTRMLQHLLRVFGISALDNPGYAGTPVDVDANGTFGPRTSKAVRRFRVRDDLPTCTGSGSLNSIYKRCIASVSEEVNDSVLTALDKHWDDFQLAVQQFDSTPNISLGTKPRSSEVMAWITGAATELKKTYSDAIHATVAPAVAYTELVDSWMVQEGGKGQWGRQAPFRIVLGGADEVGSIGFTQIINTHKYGTANVASVAALNLYRPDENMKALSVLSNDGASFSKGGGMQRAFTETDTTKDFQASNPFTAYPFITAFGTAYTDDNKDRLSKGIMAYNAGAGLSAYRNIIWPEFFRKPKIPKAAIKYSIQVQNRAGFPLRCWNWTVAVITTGGDEVCDSLATWDPQDLALTPQPIGDPGHKVCIIQNYEQDYLGTFPTGDDEYASYTFQYCEADVLKGDFWDDNRISVLPFRIP